MFFPLSWEGTLQLLHWGLVDVLRCSGSAAGRPSAPEVPMLLRCPCHMLSSSHPVKPHSPQGLASISSAVAFYSFFVVTMISSSKFLEEMLSDPSTPLVSGIDESRESQVSVPPRGNLWTVFCLFTWKHKFVTCVSNLLLNMSLQSADRKIRANEHFQRKKKITPSSNYALSWDLLLSLCRTLVFDLSKFTCNCINMHLGREGSICQREQKPRRLMAENPERWNPRW